MSYYFPKLPKSKRQVMLDLLEKFNNAKTFSKKLNEQVFNAIVSYYSSDKQETLYFLKYLKGYHSSRCQYYISKIENEETNDFHDCISDAIISHCEEKELFTHLWAMFANGQAGFENL